MDPVPELKKHVHCRNCPVYSAGAAELLDGDPPASYLADRTSHFAQPKRAEDIETRSVVIFRVASEWLALPTSVVMEVANLLPIHSLPHRQNGVVLGLASVRGELLVCVSLRQVVGAEPLAAASHERRDTAYRRLLVIRREAVRVVCPVDDVHGIHRFHPRELKAVPDDGREGHGHLLDGAAVVARALGRHARRPALVLHAEAEPRMIHRI